MLNIYVGNLPYTTDQAELESLFSQFGSVNRASVVEDRETGRSRGFGFVEMASEEDGRKAIEELNGQEYSGRPLTVNEARPREPRPNGGGGGGYNRR